MALCVAGLYDGTDMLKLLEGYRLTVLPNIIDHRLLNLLSVQERRRPLRVGVP